MFKNNKSLIYQLDNKIRNVFGDNLVFSFIGGSSARGQDRPNSDIDTFITLHESNRDQELEYFKYLSETHSQLDKLFDHCGFLMDLKTLDNLFKIATDFRQTMPYIADTSCCFTCCVLSQYNYAKATVFALFMDKIMMKHDAILDYYIQKAADFAKLDNFEYEVSQPKQFQIAPIPEHELKQKYDNLISAWDFADTPYGIGLHRFYKADHILNGKHVSPVEKSGKCPLADFNACRTVKDIIAEQCIARKQCSVL